MLRFTRVFRYDSLMPPTLDPKTTKDLYDILKHHFSAQNTPKETRPLRYVIYARKSTEDSDKQVRSITDQLVECRQFAEDHCLELGRPPTITESASAKTSENRKEFRRMLDEIRKGKYDGIIAWHPDRLARNMKDAGEIIDLVDRDIIKDLRFKAFNFENSPSGKMHLGITFVLAKQYSDHLSETVSRGIEHAIEDDAEYINRPKHGYYKDEQQRLRPDGRNHDLLRDAFHLRMEGKSFAAIARWLNEQHYTRAVKKKCGDGYEPKPFHWSQQGVHKTLRDPVYAGVVLYGDGYQANLTEHYDFKPCVSVDDFLVLNNLKGGNRDLAKLARNYRKGDNVKADLLRGIVYCDGCQEPRSAGITRKTDGKNYFYYRCDTEGCEYHKSSTRAKAVVEFVNAFLAQKPFSSKAAYDHYVDEMKRVEAGRGKERRALLATLQGKEKALAKREQSIKDFILDSDNAELKKNFAGDLRKNEADQKQVAADITKLKALIAAEKTATLLLPEFLELMDKMAQIVAKTTSMKDLDFIIRKLFSNFFVTRKNVEFATLSEPFAALKGAKVVDCAR